MKGDFFLTTWFFYGMRWLCEQVLSNNIFLTILISTILLRLITLFSDIKQRKSSAKMAELQPQLEKLQERYKDNPQKLQLEQQKLYKQSGVNAFAGCLPMILTLVFLFCFIAAFRFWGYEQNVKTIVEMKKNISEVMRETNFAGVTKDSEDVDCINALYDILDGKLENVEGGKILPESGETAPAITESGKAEPQSSQAASGSDEAKKQGKAIIEKFFEDNKDKIKISETFEQSEFLWIANIWQPDNGFSKVVVPSNTFYAKASYKQTKKLHYLNENKGVAEELTKLGIFYDGINLGKNASYEAQEGATLEIAKGKYDIIMMPLEKKFEGRNNGWFILPILATLFQLLYIWYSQKSMPAAANGQGSNKFMMFVMPVMSFFFCLSYTSAFAIYWTLSSITMLIVNIILSKVFKKNKKTK